MSQPETQTLVLREGDLWSNPRKNGKISNNLIKWLEVRKADRGDCGKIVDAGVDVRLHWPAMWRHRSFIYRRLLLHEQGINCSNTPTTAWKEPMLTTIPPTNRSI